MSHKYPILLNNVRSHVPRSKLFFGVQARNTNRVLR